MNSKIENNLGLQRSLNVLKRGFRNRQDLLYLFSFYIASNPDFKYNTTYLTDSIDSFFEDQECFKIKQNTFHNIIDYLKDQTKGKYEIEVVFDHVFKYNVNESQDLEVFNETNSPFSFYKLGEKSFMMKLIFLQPNRIEYLYEIKKYKTDEEWLKKVDNFINIISKQDVGK